MGSPSSRFKAAFIPIVALLVALAITSVITIVVFTPLYLTKWGPLSTPKRTIYITGTTIIATVLTAFIASQVQKLLLRKFDRGLQELVDGQSDIEQLNKRWRAILNTGGFFEKLSHLRIVTIYGFIGLITTAIVASLTPTATKLSFPYKQKVFNGPSRHGINALCTDIVPLSQVPPGQSYYWDLGNGSAYSIQTNLGGCPTRVAQLLAGGINTYDSDAFAYSDGGVAVHHSAIGVPITVYSSERALAPELNTILTRYGSNVIETNQCARVMTHNPISCRKGGTLSVSKTWFNATSDDGLCTGTWNFLSRDPTLRSTMVKGMCTHDEVGQGTMVMATTGQYAHWLAVAINDKDPPGTNAGDRYAVSCTVDTRNVYEYRKVTLELQNSNRPGSRSARLLKSDGDVCSGPPLHVALTATTASANWQTLFQNDGLDGWFDFLYEVSGYGRDPPYAFNNSATALEDALGLVAALVGSRLNSSSTYAVNSTVIVAAVRIGNGKHATMAYIIPSTVAAIALLYLISTTYSLEPPLYRSTMLGDLIELRRRCNGSHRPASFMHTALP